MKTFLLIQGPVHFALAFKDSALANGDDGGREVSEELARRMNLHSSIGLDLPFYMAIDDDGLDPDLSPTMSVPPSKISPSNFPSNRNTP
jgi:hypothetical protein